VSPYRFGASLDPVAQWIEQHSSKVLVARSSRAGVAVLPGRSVLRQSGPTLPATTRRTSVVVGAPDVALRDLSLDRSPGIAACDELRYVANLLAPNVVEVEHEWVGLTAVDTRMGKQVREHTFTTRRDDSRLIPTNAGHLALMVRLMALGFVSGEALRAPRIEPIGVTAATRELRPRLKRATSPARQELRSPNDADRARSGYPSTRALICAATVFATCPVLTGVCPYVELGQRLGLAAGPARLRDRHKRVGQVLIPISISNTYSN
jgi:Fe2+ transport system protein FeoA